MTDKLKVERDGDVCVIRIDDPASMNAVTKEVAEAMHAALKEAGETSRCVLLGGSERAFCSGANLGNGGMTNRDDVGASLESTFNPLMTTLRDLSIPVVSSVRGAAAGVGASLALAADIIVAGRSAYFLEAFARIGLVPDGGASWLLTQAVGRVRAMEMMLLADKIPAEKAHEWGLVTRLTDDDKTEDEAMALARRLAAGPSRALGLIRRNTWLAAESTFAQALQAEREGQREAGRHPDFAEGVAAFREKRPAKFGA